MLNLISLGAGVQSTTMALMAAHGEIEPMPDGALFADTGWEPTAVYEHLNWLMSPNVLPFPVYMVNNGNIRDGLTKVGVRYAAVPFFLGPTETMGQGLGRRQCTHEYKLKPLKWKARELLGKGRKDRIAPGSVSVWIGISVDEAVRMKPADVKWQTNRWPLIEAGMSRSDCKAWLARHGYPMPPKSACIGCPYRSNESWRLLRDTAPDDWAQAVDVDAKIREVGQFKDIKRIQYMHRSCVPLGEADIDEEHKDQGDLWGNECTGLCGV